jgi:hypothetical protein
MASDRKLQEAQDRIDSLRDLASGAVDYYQRLVDTDGPAWANGLRRAQDFLALVNAEEYSPEAWNDFISVLEREYESEGSAFHIMLVLARSATEPRQGMAGPCPA